MRFVKLNWKQLSNNFKLFRYFGLVLIVISIIIWALSIIEMKGIEIMLSNSQTYDLTIEEIWSYEGAKLWWKEAYTSIILPTTIILSISGFSAILSPKIFSVTQEILLKNNLPSTIKKNDFSTKNNLMNEVKEIKNLKIENTGNKNNNKKIGLLREKWQYKIEKDIENKENNIQKLRIEINDLKYIRDELDKFQLLSQEKT